MKKKVLLSVFMALIMMLSILPMSAFAAEETSPAIDTDTKTITIKSADDLAWLSTYTGTIEGLPSTFQGWTVAIVNDIDLNNMVWTPIPDFHGTMRGVPAEGSTNNYVTITGLNVDVTGSAGLCAGGGGAKFENLMIRDSNITTTAPYAGAFIGNGFTSSFENCHTFNTSVHGDRFVGGIVGFAYGSFTNCTVMANDGDTVISARLDATVFNDSGDNVGGIVGQVGEGGFTISGCVVDGVKLEGSRQVGGITGLAMYGNKISGCTVSNTEISATATLDLPLGSLSRTAAVGGIVGQIQPNTNPDTPVTICGNTVGPNTTISRTNGSTRYCGWVLGDAVRGDNYSLSDNTYIGTTTIPEVGA